MLVARSWRTNRNAHKNAPMMTVSNFLEYHDLHTKAKIAIANALAGSSYTNRDAAFWGSHNVQYAMES